MGDVLVSLAAFRQRKINSTELQRTTKDIEYLKLQELETELFGAHNSELSFLELIAAETEHPKDVPASVSHAVDYLAIDMCRKEYLQFENYDTQQYEDFLREALVYHYRFETSQPRRMERVSSVAMHLFRYREGLPSLSEVDEIEEFKKTLFGGLRYDRRAARADKTLIAFKDAALMEASDRASIERSKAR